MMLIGIKYGGTEYNKLAEFIDPADLTYRFYLYDITI